VTGEVHGAVGPSHGIPARARKGLAAAAGDLVDVVGDVAAVDLDAVVGLCVQVHAAAVGAADAAERVRVGAAPGRAQVAQVDEALDARVHVADVAAPAAVELFCRRKVFWLVCVLM